MRGVLRRSVDPPADFCARRRAIRIFQQLAGQDAQQLCKHFDRAQVEPAKEKRAALQEFLIDVMSEFKTREKTIIFSTHLMETAERLCNDILLINKSRKVVSGSLREVKASYGKNLIALRTVGGEAVLNDATIVKSIEDHADEKFVEMANGFNSQVLLKKLLEAGAEISKFEEVEPTLNDIFIDQIGGHR